MVKRKQGRHDIDLVFAGAPQKAVDMAPESRRASRHHAVSVNIDSDVAVAGNPDPGGINAGFMQLLEMFVPPNRIKPATKIIPSVPRGVGAVDPNPVSAGAKLRAGDGNAIAKTGTSRQNAGQRGECADHPIHG